MADPHDLGPITNDPIRFQEAIDALRDKVPMTQELFDQLTEEERQFAFTVANVTQADLVTDVLEAMETAVRDGTTFEEFQASDVADRLTEAWGGEGGRLEGLFRTTTMSAYNQGRFAQMTAPETLKARSYWRFDAIRDAVTCPICGPCNGVILPADHPWWRTRYPCLHPGCRCLVVPMTQKEAEDSGITTSPPDVTPVAGFGKAPSVRGSDYEPDPADYPDAISGTLEDRLADVG